VVLTDCNREQKTRKKTISHFHLWLNKQFNFPENESINQNKENPDDPSAKYDII
jgi:hypothetical protein